VQDIGGERVEATRVHQLLKPYRLCRPGLPPVS
jgi:hypothetical protein